MAIDIRLCDRMNIALKRKDRYGFCWKKILEALSQNEVVTLKSIRMEGVGRRSYPFQICILERPDDYTVVGRIAGSMFYRGAPVKVIRMSGSGALIFIIELQNIPSDSV